MKIIYTYNMQVFVYDLRGRLIVNCSEEELRAACPDDSLDGVLQSLKTHNFGRTKEYLYYNENSHKQVSLENEYKIYMDKDLNYTPLDGKDGGNYDKSGNSAHYQHQFIEYIRDVELTQGTIIAFFVCENNARKYRGRAGKKSGVPADKDLIKATWYENMSAHFMKKISNHGVGLPTIPGNPYVNMPGEVLNLINKSGELTLNTGYYSLSELIKDA